MLIVFGAAVLGVLVEAFVPAGHRCGVQLGSSPSSRLAGAFVAVVRCDARAPSEHRGEGAVAVDGPALFLQGTILLLSPSSACCSSPSARLDPAG